jgi:hypothetical protein
MVDHPAAGWGLLDAPEQVHEHTLARAAPADNPDDLPFRDLKGNIVEYFFSVEIHAEVIHRDEW